MDRKRPENEPRCSESRRSTSIAGWYNAPRVSSARASTRHPERLPSPSALLKLTRALSVLDEILWPDWDWRFYSFDKERDGTCLASMRNGEGDLWYLLLLPNGGAVLRGFDHNSVMNPYRHEDERLWPGLFDGMPRSLLPWKNAVDIEPHEVTFVMWHPPRGRWQAGSVTLPAGDDPDGSEWLLELLNGDPASYARYTDDRLGHAVDLDAIRAVYNGSLDARIIQRLNPRADESSILKAARKMGFPMSKTKPKTQGKPVAQVAASPTGPAVRRRRAGEASFTVSVHDNKVELLIHGKPVASCDVLGPEFYNALFHEVKARIAKPE
jgi:hypothetical protein